MPRRAPIGAVAARFHPVLPQRRKRRRPHALRVSVSQHPARLPFARCRPEMAPRQAILPAGSLQPGGIHDRGKGILPYSDRSFLGYRLLQEYFSFPEKFFFFDLTGFDRVRQERLRHSIRNPDLPQAARPAAPADRARAKRRQRYVSARLHADRQSVRAHRRAHSHHADQDGIPDRSGSAPAVEHRSLFGRPRHFHATYLEEPQIYEPFYSLRHAATDETQQTFLVHAPAAFVPQERQRHRSVHLAGRSGFQSGASSGRDADVCASRAPTATRRRV